MARMFNTLGVVLYCLLGACPVFVAGTGREIEMSCHTNTSRIRRPRPYYASITSGSVPFRSVPSFIASPEKIDPHADQKQENNFVWPN